jgi:hypothetical protein
MIKLNVTNQKTSCRTVLSKQTQIKTTKKNAYFQNRRKNNFRTNSGEYYPGQWLSPRKSSHKFNTDPDNVSKIKKIKQTHKKALIVDCPKKPNVLLKNIFYSKNTINI